MDLAQLFRRVSATSLMALCSAALMMLPAFAQTSGDAEDPKDLLATQVREQGHECKNPQKAQELKDQSSADETVWQLECENTKYRIKLIPDMAAEIEQTD